MKIYKKNDYDDNVKIEIDINKYLKPWGNKYLKYIKSKLGADFEKYEKHLIGLLKTDTPIDISSSKMDFYLKDWVEASHSKKLWEAWILKVCSLLKFNKLPNKDKITVKTKDYLRSWIHIMYYLAKSLESVMIKKEALLFFKEMVDKNTRENSKDKKGKVSELLSINETCSPVFKKGFNFVEFEVNEGRVGNKVTKCKHCESLKEFNDPDYAYAVICHYDFEAAKMYNPNFLLTRTSTLAEGKSYCDFIWHDKRIDKNLEHPPKEFWENLS